MRSGHIATPIRSCLLALVAACALGAGGTALAAGNAPKLKSSLYLTAIALYDFPLESKIDADDTTVSPASNFGLGAAVGRRIDDMRFEFQALYSNHDIDSISRKQANGATETVSAAGNAELVTLMMNGYHDVLGSGFLQPYLGAGAGIAVITANEVKALDGKAGMVDGTSVAPALQALAGMEVRLSPDMSFDVGYAFMYIVNPSATISGGRNDGRSETLENAFSHRIAAGLRYSF